ncbi:MAG: hypothetical protein U9R19_12275 [Bacteroidota bacterium]|nr:hypothetical protein [Bacteroidota bacterium]
MKALSEKEIALLKEQISKLNATDFELEAWKTYTIILLERIFGSGSQKIKIIQNINYDYSSWSLRDSSGTGSNIDACKKLGWEILTASIKELENFGFPDLNQISEKETSKNESLNIEKIIVCFEDELKVSQFKELKAILKSGDNSEDKKSRLIGKLKEFGVNTSPEILSNILLNEYITKALS